MKTESPSAFAGQMYRSHSWQLSLASYVICCLSVFALSAGSPLNAQDKALRIRVLNSRNGNPIRDEKLDIYVGTGKDNLHTRVTDKDGYIALMADSSIIIRLSPTLYVDCREFTATPIEVGYHVAEIMTTGISAENLCGKFRTKAAPGELILYERPRTLWERLWL